MCISMVHFYSGIHHTSLLQQGIQVIKKITVLYCLSCIRVSCICNTFYNTFIFKLINILISFLRIIQRIDIPVGIKALLHIMQVSARSWFYFLFAHFDVKNKIYAYISIYVITFICLLILHHQIYLLKKIFVLFIFKYCMYSF